MNAGHNSVADERAVHIARHVTWVGFWVNAGLGVLKVLAGIFGRSSAMIAEWGVIRFPILSPTSLY